MGGSDYTSLPEDIAEQLTELETLISALNTTLESFDTKLQNISHAYYNSSNILFLDSDDYWHSETSYQLQSTYKIPSLLDEKSLFNIKYQVYSGVGVDMDVKITYKAPGESEIIIDESSFTNPSSWTDKTISAVNEAWENNGLIRVYTRKTDGASDCGIRNIEFQGNLTPIIKN